MNTSLPKIDFSQVTDKELIHTLLNILEQQQTQITLLTKKVEEQAAEIAKLKGQPKKPQFASSTKQSSISVTALLKENKGGKKNWHKASKHIPIDQEVTVPEQKQCDNCGSTKFEVVRTETKLIQGMIIRRNNILYRGREKRCIKCGKHYKPQFPPETKGLSFDSTIQTIASLFPHADRFTRPLLHGFFTSFGVQISYGELSHMIHRNSNKLDPAYQHIERKIRQSRYTQSDATGAKRKLKTGEIINQHLNILGNQFLSLFKITRHYNAKEMNKLLGKEGRKRPFVSDDGSPNGECLKCIDKQLCWVHEIRLYKKIFPFFTPYQKEQTNTLTQWQTFYHKAKAYGRDPTEKEAEEIKELFNDITKQKTGYKKLDRQLELTKKKKERLLMFLKHPYLPIHNNQCEQDLREAVLIRKITGGTKSSKGDRSLERHLSVIQTIKKQGLPMFQTLHGLLTGQLSPAILTQKSV